MPGQPTRKASIWWILSPFFWWNLINTVDTKCCPLQNSYIITITFNCVFVLVRGWFGDWLSRSSSKRLRWKTKGCHGNSQGWRRRVCLWWDGHWQTEWRGSLQGILWSCAIPAAHQASASLRFPSPAWLRSLRRTLNVNETARRNSFSPLSVSVSDRLHYLQAAQLCMVRVLHHRFTCLRV